MALVRRRFWLVGVLLIAAAGVAAWLLQLDPVAGPWRAQIVDAETGQPLEGVIVVVHWALRTLGWPHAGYEFYDAEEIVSDADGRIVVTARRFPRGPFRFVTTTDVKIFKPGYGIWRFRDHEGWSVKDWHRFGGDAMFELPPIRTLEERRRMVRRIMPLSDVPREKVPLTQAAYDREYRALPPVPQPRTTRTPREGKR
jgi:hypothetical protein